MIKKLMIKKLRPKSNEINQIQKETNSTNNNGANNIFLEKKNIFLILILIFSIVALISSIMIVIQNKNDSTVLNQICSITGYGCESVQNSVYGTIFGVKMVWFGVIAFILLILLLIFELITRNLIVAKLIFVASIIAGIFGLYLIYLQAFVLNQYCTYCLIIDSSSMCMMIITIIYGLLAFSINAKTRRRKAL